MIHIVGYGTLASGGVLFSNDYFSSLCGINLEVKRAEWKEDDGGHSVNLFVLTVAGRTRGRGREELTRWE